MDQPHPPKWPSTLNWPDSPTKHSDDSTLESPEAFVRVPVVVSEKIDGGNTGLYRGEVYARSVSGPSHAGWMAMVRKYHAWKTSYHPNLVLNGEDIYGIHSIRYEPVLPQDTFRLFGVRIRSCDLAEMGGGYGGVPCESLSDEYVMLSWDEIEAQAASFDMRTVPVLFRGQFDSVQQITEWFRDNLKQPSAIGGPDREGFVIRHAGRILQSQWGTKAAKFIREKHVQTNQHWSMNWQPCPLKDSP
jgi:hypothetical protein